MENNEQVTLAQLEEFFDSLSRRLTAQWEQRAQAEDQRTQALDAREEELKHREATARAAALLKEKELPEELASCLSFDEEDSAADAIAALEKAFRAAVQQAVEQRLAADAPKTGALIPLDQLSDEEYYAAVCRNQ